jgi:hypothetical protein
MFGSMILALLPVLVAGELANNLVYRSPYSNHEGLAMDTHAIEKRHLEASSALRKRQAQTLAPSGTPDTYIWKGDYATADWSSSSYIYAGAINFTHSVASGDPFEDSVILWTRAYPTDAFRVDVPVCVKWAIYTNAEASGEPVNKNFAYTSVDVDFTVKVEARDLQPYTQYFYQFTNCAGEGQSPIGRTKTAPAKDGKIKNEVAFAIYSWCGHSPCICGSDDPKVPTIPTVRVSHYSGGRLTSSRFLLCLFGPDDLSRRRLRPALGRLHVSQARLCHKNANARSAMKESHAMGPIPRTRRSTSIGRRHSSDLAVAS